jgi:hypothetical protein
MIQGNHDDSDRDLIQPPKTLPGWQESNDAMPGKGCESAFLKADKPTVVGEGTLFKIQPLARYRPPAGCTSETYRLGLSGNVKGNGQMPSG